jgi:hypothetical protein
MARYYFLVEPAFNHGVPLVHSTRTVALSRDDVAELSRGSYGSALVWVVMKS